jgi:hypothetical protein
MKFHIVFNKETWYSRILSYIFLFGVFPWIVFVIGQRYQEYVDLVSGATYMSLEWHNTDYLQDYNPRNNQQYILENKTEGKWRSVNDPKFVLIFRDLNRYFEYYDGIVVNSGAWFLKQSLVNTKYVDRTASKIDGAPEGTTTYLYERLINGPQSFAQKEQAQKELIAKNKGKDGLDLYNDDFIYQISFSSDYSRLTLIYLETGEVMNFTREYYNPGSLQKIN